MSDWVSSFLGAMYGVQHKRIDHMTLGELEGALDQYGDAFPFQQSMVTFIAPSMKVAPYSRRYAPLTIVCAYCGRHRPKDNEACAGCGAVETKAI